MKQAPKLHGAEEIQDWLTGYFGDLLEMEPKEVDLTKPFDSYGLDSAAAVGMTAELGRWLGQEVDPTLPYVYPTVETLGRHLATAGNLDADGGSTS